MDRIQAGQTVKHFKGGLYIVLGTNVLMHDTKERYVIYMQKSTGLIFIRPWVMFCSEVDREKYPDVKQQYRFEVVE